MDVKSEENVQLLFHIFEAKKVPLRFLGLVSEQRDFHRADFPAVEATVKAGVVLENFDFYFDYVLKVVEDLKPFWDK